MDSTEHLSQKEPSPSSAEKAKQRPNTCHPNEATASAAEKQSTANETNSTNTAAARPELAEQSCESAGSGRKSLTSSFSSQLSNELSECERLKTDSGRRSNNGPEQASSSTTAQTPSKSAQFAQSALGQLMPSLLSKSSLGIDQQLLCDSDTATLKDAKERDRLFAIERANLITLFKSVNKSLIENSMCSNRVVDYDNNQILHNFFNLLEQILKHALKSKKGLLFSRNELWNLFESLEPAFPNSKELINSVRDLPHIKTSIGRARAFIRLAFVQKQLPDFFKHIIDNNDTLNKFYEPQSIMQNEEAVQVAGILIGLSIIDTNWCAKDEDLDNLPLTIDFTPYMKVVKAAEDSCEEEEVDKSALDALLDQKNYVEELNKQLSSKVAGLQERVRELEARDGRSRSLREGLTEFLKENEDVGGEDRLSANELLNRILDQDQTFLQELLGARDQLRVEQSERAALEKRTAQIEKEIHEKQETISSIRKQLEEIKQINIQLYNKLRECEQTLKGKVEQTTLLEQKNGVMTTTLLSYEAKLIASENKFCALAEKHKQVCEKFVEQTASKSKLENSLEEESKAKSETERRAEQLSEKLSELEAELREIKESNFDYEKLRREFLGLQKRCSDYELTMEELGIQLQESKLETEQLKENSFSKDAVWKPDEQAADCHACGKPFSVARRRHHCRHCGNIFCGACSDNKLPLPSSQKPLRVCDTCNVLLLERYSAK